MGIITGRENVLAIYREAVRARRTLPCFCTENLTTTEAVLSATLERAGELGEDSLPVIIAITNNYAHRPQTHNYTHTRRWDVGLRLFMADLRALTEAGSPYAGLQVLVHLDHIQHDADRELLGWDMAQFSSIMFDASGVPLEDNIRLTAAFVRERGSEIVVEGACDEIVDSTGKERGDLTTPERAQEYCERTGADLIVANLGTEHRASIAELKYRGDNARAIRDRIGNRIVLHGASSVPAGRIADLFGDGVCKVNLWTALERDSSPALLDAMVRNAGKVAGGKAVQALRDRGFLGPACEAGPADLGYFTTVWRQGIVFERMKDIARQYFRLWYR